MYTVYYPCISYLSVGILPVVINNADFSAGSHTLTLSFTLSTGGTGSVDLNFNVPREAHRHVSTCG